jgi:alpha-amylase
MASKCYLPANKLLLKMAKKLGNKLKVSFSFSGIVLEQFELYAPEVIESFMKLAKTGCVEFVAETYSHSLASLSNPVIFREQVKRNEEKLVTLFGQKPRVFRNTEMIYSDLIGAQVAEMGYEAILTEGAKQVLGWKSPGFLYVNTINPRLKVMMRNFKLSDDISFRFSNQDWSEYPLTAGKFIDWIEKMPKQEEIVNIFLSYETFGERQAKESGIFAFLENLIEKVADHPSIKLATPSEIISKVQPVSAVSVPNPVSWADEERDLTAWLGNEMQKEAFEKLYNLEEQLKLCTDNDIVKDWNYLQASDHFFYMSTKHSSDGEVHRHYNPFGSPYDAFINYMNVLSDFSQRLGEKEMKSDIAGQIGKMELLIKEKDQIIKDLETRILTFKKSLKRINKI